MAITPIISVWGAYHGGIGGGGAFFYARYPLHDLFPGLVNPSTTYTVRFLTYKLGGQTVDVLGVRVCNDDDCAATQRPTSAWQYIDVSHTSDASGHLYADAGHYAMQIGAAAIVYIAYIALYDPSLPPSGDIGLDYDGFAPAPAAPGALVGVVDLTQYTLEQDEGQTSLGGCFPTSPDSAVCITQTVVQPLPLPFPYEIDWSERFVEQREPETTIQVLRDNTEQRRGLSEIANRQWSYLIKCLESEYDEFQQVQGRVIGGQHLRWWVPYWPRARFITAPISPGGVVVTVASTTHMAVIIGQAVLLYRNSSYWEVVRVTAVSGTTIGIGGTSKSWFGGAKKDKVIPCYRGIMAPEASLVNYDVDYGGFPAVFDIEIDEL